jgi:hypothetical protein
MKGRRDHRTQGQAADDQRICPGAERRLHPPACSELCSKLRLDSPAGQKSLQLTTAIHVPLIVVSHGADRRKTDCGRSPHFCGMRTGRRPSNMALLPPSSPSPPLSSWARSAQISARYSTASRPICRQNVKTVIVARTGNFSAEAHLVEMQAWLIEHGIGSHELTILSARTSSGVFRGVFDTAPDADRFTERFG